MCACPDEANGFTRVWRVVRCLYWAAPSFYHPLHMLGCSCVMTFARYEDEETQYIHACGFNPYRGCFCQQAQPITNP